MLDRNRIVGICHESFPDATVEQVAAAADAIVRLDADWSEWEEITDHLPEFGFNASVQCRDICYLAEQWTPGTRIRVLRKRVGDAANPAGGRRHHASPSAGRP